MKSLSKLRRQKSRASRNAVSHSRIRKLKGPENARAKLRTPADKGNS